MSGPKVVRVVTREELEAICARLVAQVRAAAAELLRILDRHGLLTDAIASDIESRIQALAAQIAKGQFASLQKQAPLAVAFLRQESERFQQVAIANAAKARHDRRQVSDAARSVRDAILQMGKPVPPVLDRIVERANRAKPDEIASMRAQVDAAFKSLVAIDAKMPRASTGLAAKLSEGLEQRTLAQWLGSRPSLPATSNQMSKLLAEIEVLGDDEIIAAFADRAISIDMEQSTERRRLLEDSLTLELSTKAKALKNAQATRTKLADLEAELGTLVGKEAEGFRKRIASMLAGGNFAGSGEALIEGRALIDAAARDDAATARRRAVLQGLATLGYEVREGMETAWATEGRLVVARPGSRDYGVELGAPAHASRLQMRVVGAERPISPRNRQRDTDQENQWCREVGDLIASLGAAGTEIVIERSQPVGAQPLKSTSLLGRSDGDDSTETAAPPIARSLRPT